MPDHRGQFVKSEMPLAEHRRRILAAYRLILSWPDIETADPDTGKKKIEGDAAAPPGRKMRGG